MAGKVLLGSAEAGAERKEMNEDGDKPVGVVSVSENCDMSSSPGTLLHR